MNLMGAIAVAIVFIIAVSILTLFLFSMFYCVLTDNGDEEMSTGKRIFWYVFVRLIFLCWLLGVSAIAGHFWLRIAGVENVPQWAVTLFKTEGNDD